MPRKKNATPPLDTIWEVNDQLWKRIEPIMVAAYPLSPAGGRPRTVDFRSTLNAVIHRLRSGCQWNRMPTHWGDDSTIHRWFSRWCRDGVFEQIWATLLTECDELGGLNWKWQSADGCMNKARFGGEKKRTQPDRPGEARHQEKPAGRSRRRTALGRDRRRQRP